MKKTFIIILLTCCSLVCSFAHGFTYKSLDTKNPISFGGDHIIFEGKKIELNSKSFFVDAQLPNEVVKKHSYVFNSINEAVKHLSDGTEKTPMTLHIAPYVYWIDNPDDPEVRIPQEGEGLPYGLIIKCNWLRFNGLTDNPENVILACNRGQTMGAKGNFTMFKISGDGTSTENITMGNYCNVDLIYPLKPELGREKRGSAIVQAQLVICNGDKIFARNSRFISRLNLCPFYGSGKRVLFVNCHFESTDDALCKTAVYMNSTFDFYSSKPFGSTTGTGSIFLDCDIRSLSSKEQYFTKGGGQVAVINSRLKTETVSYWGWRDFPATESRNYQYNVSLDNQPFSIGIGRNPKSTVDMTGKTILNAYQFEYQGKDYYNIYNLLQGNDGWDPLDMKSITLAAEKKNDVTYTNLPIQLSISPSRDSIETGRATMIIRPTMKRFGNYEMAINEKITWKIDPKFETLVKIEVAEDQTCKIIPTNKTDLVQEVVVEAISASGLEAAAIVYIVPPVLDAPKLLAQPKILNKGGQLLLSYQLGTKYEDQSLISWYRCSDAKGNNPIEIAVSRMNIPKRAYELSVGDQGSYIMAIIEPKDLRSKYGETIKIIEQKPISPKDIVNRSNVMHVDLNSLSYKHQPKVIPGYWTWDCYAPEDTKEYPWEADNSIDPWFYGRGINGAANEIGLLQATRGARMRYTPVGDKFGDMKINFTAVPAKTAGQGFGSATAQYMDIFIKFDTEKMNGYALRIVRTTKFHDALDFVFVRYENGKATMISNPVSTDCYRPNCHISVEVKGNKLIANAKMMTEHLRPAREDVKSEVAMEITIDPNIYGGMGFQHTGTVWGGATLIKDLTIEWTN